MNIIIKITITLILTSFYLFPFEFVFLPGINTKMAMAGAGLIILVINLARGKNAQIDKDVFILSLIGLFISIISQFAMVYNNTTDGSFVSYFFSTWVWLGSAYFLTKWTKWIYGYLSVKIVVNYMIAVCVVQCIIAFTMTLSPLLKGFVDSFLGGTEAFMGKAGDRVYGIGCALDVAGGRFAVILTMITFMLVGLKDSVNRKRYVIPYLIAFFVIALIGNMIGRSTTIGLVISIFFLIYSSLSSSNNVGYIWKSFLMILLIGLPIVVYLYNVNENIHANIRFAFEGFFSLVEKGYWDMNSTNILTNHMIVFPDNLKTWLIGDGYGANPVNDPYYIGPSFHGFYMGTDIGYIRFLFYFGIMGALGLIAFIVYAIYACSKRFPCYQQMFFLLLMINLIIWCKVTTDVFLIIAPFLCISKEENEEYEKQIA